MSKLNINIKVLGVGGAGCNMVSHLYSQYIQNFEKKDQIEVISINTDVQVLDESKTDRQLVIGEKLTNGFGAGARPEIGKESALESYQEIVEMLQGADMVFIASGMGGGTGTGAASIVAQAAKEVGALTVSIVTKPFKFEGPKRAKYAQEGLEELSIPSDSLIVIDNEKLMGLQEEKLQFKKAFRLVDDVLAKAVQGILSIVLESSDNDDINVDFADLRTILSYPGSSVMSIAVASGENAAVEVIKKTLDNPLLETTSIKGSRGILINFTIHEDALLEDIYTALDVLYENTTPDADIIFGTTTSLEIPRDEVRATLIATGFPGEVEVSKVRKFDDLVGSSNENDEPREVLRIKL
jgi:cell division protein FtsZ